MTTIQKTMRLINYLKRTKKADTCDFMIDTKEDEHWFYYFSFGGFYNGSYFAIAINHTKLNNQEIIKIENTTDNIPEIKQLLERYDLKP